MTLSPASNENHRVVSGMRTTGQLHLGHYHGVLKNWIKLQHEYECFFFAADWHALTTHYEDTRELAASTYDMIVDWMAVGIDPGVSCIFVQSRVPEHAELHLLLSMLTPISWLERVPTYKDQQEKLKEKDLCTYGFLGYPLLQTADVLIYKGGHVPVGEDQVAHIELSREIARRFNFLYGREPGFEEKVEVAIKNLGKKNAKLYRDLRKKFQETGDADALETAQALLSAHGSISLGDRDRLYGYLEGNGKIILPEPQPLLTETSKFPGLDGQKMSKSYQNTISLRDPLPLVEKKIKMMQTDPARVRRHDPGEPTKCPVYSLHEVYSDDDLKSWVVSGCRSAGIGCLECKQPLIDALKAELEPIQEKIAEYSDNENLVKRTINTGCERARDEARQTLEQVREVMGLSNG